MDYQALVLAGIVSTCTPPATAHTPPDPLPEGYVPPKVVEPLTGQERLSTAVQRLELEHFTDVRYRVMWEALQAGYDLTATVLSLVAFKDLLLARGADPAKVIDMCQLFARMRDVPVSDGDFLYAIGRLRDQREAVLTGQALADALEILDEGVEQRGVVLQGAQDARLFLYQRLAQVEQLSRTEVIAEGDMRKEAPQMLADYEARKASRAQGVPEGVVKYGIKVLDDELGGIQTGDLALAAAYTSQGKSMFAVHVAYHAMLTGRNVFFATSETSRAQINRRLVARHTRHESFGYPEGVDFTDIRRGTLNSDEEALYRLALDDLYNNDRYGVMYVSQIPRGASLNYLEARMTAQSKSRGVDLAVVDYLALLAPDRRREKAQEEANDTLKAAKVLATSFNHGRGVALFSPWQMSQASYRQALQAGHYTLGNLADTSEAEKSSDVILSMLRLESTPKRALMQALKLRDASVPPRIELDVDFRNAFFQQAQLSSGLESGNYGMDGF